MEKPHINKKFVIQKVNDEVVFYDPDSQLLYTLNETGAYVFSLFKRGKDIDSISVLLAKKYRVDPKTASQDVQKIMSALQKHKILLKP